MQPVPANDIGYLAMNMFEITSYKAINRKRSNCIYLNKIRPKTDVNCKIDQTNNRFHTSCVKNSHSRKIR